MDDGSFKKIIRTKDIMSDTLSTIPNLMPSGDYIFTIDIPSLSTLYYDPNNMTPILVFHQNYHNFNPDRYKLLKFHQQNQCGSLYR